jgi:hypothetical protein
LDAEIAFWYCQRPNQGSVVVQRIFLEFDFDAYGPAVQGLKIAQTHVNNSWMLVRDSRFNLITETRNLTI